MVHICVSGDVVGTGLFSSHLDAYNIFGMIFGNGEHYMYNFATNLYWLKFLKITNYLSRSVLKTSLDALNVGKWRLWFINSRTFTLVA